MKNKRIFLSWVLVTVLLAGCSDDSSNDNPRFDAPPGNRYQDSFLQFSYPADWTLSTENTSISGQVFASDINELGGRSNCGVNSGFIPGASIIELTDEFTEALNYLPDPTTTFLEVSGFPASRVSGDVMASGRTIPADTLTIYDTDTEYAHLVFCVGVDDAVVDLIFSTTRLN